MRRRWYKGNEIPREPSIGDTDELIMLGRWRVSDNVILAALALVKLLFHLVTSGGYGIFRDELYYVACAEHLDFGYVDHPSLSIVILSLWRAVAGDSLLALRFPSAVAGAGLVFLAGLLARELGGHRRAQVVAALAVLFAPVYLATNHFFSMNAFDPLFWALLLYVAVRILGRDEERGWIVFGILAGLGMQNKYSVAFLTFGLVVGLVLTRQRRQFLSPWLWVGGAIAVLLFLPHIVWQAQNGWPTREFIANATASKNYPVSPAAFATGQILLLNPFALPLWLAGLIFLLVSPRARHQRPLGIAYVAIFALLMLQQAKVYYLAPIYPLLLAAGAVSIEAVSARPRLGWLLPAVAVLVVLSGVALLPMAVPVLRVTDFLAYAKVLGVREPQMERSERAQLPQIFADMHGWDELVETVARAYDDLPAAERDRAVIAARNYGEAGAIDFLGRGRGLPKAISGHNSYYLWGFGSLGPDSVVISVGFPCTDLSPYFQEVEEVDRTRCAYCMPHENDQPVCVARGLRRPAAELWLKVRRYI